VNQASFGLVLFGANCIQALSVEHAQQLKPSWSMKGEYFLKEELETLLSPEWELIK